MSSVSALYVLSEGPVPPLLAQLLSDFASVWLEDRLFDGGSGDMAAAGFIRSGGAGPDLGRIEAMLQRLRAIGLKRRGGRPVAGAPGPEAGRRGLGGLRGPAPLGPPGLRRHASG